MVSESGCATGWNIFCIFWKIRGVFLGFEFRVWGMTFEGEGL